MKSYSNACFMDSNVPPPAKHPKDDFIWTLTQEPHLTRRREIMKKYPEVKRLFDIEHNTKWLVLAITIVQLSIASLVFNHADSWKSPWFWLVAYFVGGTANQSLFLSVHELCHNLGFKTPRYNKLWSILVANAPIGFPYAASFKPYHMEHHRYQGVEGLDTDLPTAWEAKFFDSFLGKLFFASFQIVFYAIRPVMVKQHPFTRYHALNVAYIFALDYALYSVFGSGALKYLVASTMIAGSGIHPCAAHFLAEHYVFSGEYETYSYYGWLNMFCFNVGYHNEHHDFPNIPWTKLPALKALAPEYYDILPYHESWPLVTWKFVMDSRFGVGNRVKRVKKTNDERYQEFSISATNSPATSREASPELVDEKEEEKKSK